MPTKHIDDQTWRLVEKRTVEAVVATRVSIKETEMLTMLIKKGLENLNEDDIEKIIRKKKR